MYHTCLTVRVHMKVLTKLSKSESFFSYKRLNFIVLVVNLETTGLVSLVREYWKLTSLHCVLSIAPVCSGRLTQND